MSTGRAEFASVGIRPSCPPAPEPCRPEPCHRDKCHDGCRCCKCVWKIILSVLLWAIAFIGFVIAIVAFVNILGLGMGRDFGYVYDNTNQTVGGTLPSAGVVTFNHNGPLGSGITHAPGTGAIVFAHPGFYSVIYYVNVLAPTTSRFGLFLDGVAVGPSTVFGESTPGPLTAPVIVHIPTAGSVLTLRNVGGPGAVVLGNAAALPPRPVVSAAVQIHRV